jgi:hypothetical protein
MRNCPQSLQVLGVRSFPEYTVQEASDLRLFLHRYPKSREMSFTVRHLFHRTIPAST